MPPLLQVASDVFIYANGCNIPFYLGLQMTSNIQPGDGAGTSLANTCRAVWGVSNKMKRGSLVAQSIPARQQVMGQDFCVVLRGIRCPVNLCQLRPAILNMSPKILPPPPQAPRCASSISAWLSKPMSHALSAITKMLNETALAFWHCTSWDMKMSYCFSHRFDL